MGVLAGGEQLAEDLLQRAEVVHLAAGYCRQGLVEERHALLGAVIVNQGGPQVGQGHELQIVVADPPTHIERCSKTRLPPRPVAFPHADVERHPPSLTGRGVATQQGLGASQPATHDRSVADDRPVHVGQRPRDPHRSDPIVALPMGGIRPFPTRDRRNEVQLQIRRPGQPLDHVTRCRINQCTLECATGACRITCPKRALTLGNQLSNRRDHPPMIPRNTC